MAKIESSFFDLSTFDALSRLGTPVHRLDPRVKVAATMAFIVAVVSFGKYELSGLVPFALYPVSLMAAGNLPFGYMLRRVLLAAPFAILVGIFNPIFDREILARLGPLEISGGWVSFASILLRFLLTVSAALVLVASTGIHGVCQALDRLGLPRSFTVQLLFLYRYLFVLVDEASRMTRARALRSFGTRGTGVRVYGYLIGQLLLRTMDRAQRIHEAMLCRGFDGEIRPSRALALRRADVLFVVGWSAAFLLMRIFDLPRYVGELVTGHLP
ncbi:MAG: cobalt ECF transporter T component CbiQ [bacterium]